MKSKVYFTKEITKEKKREYMRKQRISGKSK